MMHCSISNCFPSSSDSYIHTGITTMACLSFSTQLFLPPPQHTHTRNQTPFIDRNLLCPEQMPPPHLFILQSSLYPFHRWLHFSSLLSDISSVSQSYGHLDATILCFSSEPWAPPLMVNTASLLSDLPGYIFYSFCTLTIYLIHPSIVLFTLYISASLLCAHSLHD